MTVSTSTFNLATVSGTAFLLIAFSRALTSIGGSDVAAAYEIKDRTLSTKHHEENIRKGSKKGTSLLMQRKMTNEEQETLSASPLTQCAVGFQKLNFKFQTFERYDIFFRDDSVMTLAQAGRYKGSEDIQEYVKFGTSFSPYFLAPEEERGYIGTDPQIRDIDEDKGICQFTIVFRSDFYFNPETTSYGSIVNTATMARFSYDYVNNYLPRINIYFSDGWFNFIFGRMLNSSKTRKLICDDTLKHSCNYDIDNCEEKLEMLNTFDGEEGETYFDGNSEGCRALHAAFALTNSKNHCPHVSLVPFADPNGKIKCHQTDKIQVNELFDDEDFILFDEFTYNVLGIDLDIGYLETCDELCATKQSRKSTYQENKKAEAQEFEHVASGGGRRGFGHAGSWYIRFSTGKVHLFTISTALLYPLLTQSWA